MLAEIGKSHALRLIKNGDTSIITAGLTKLLDADLFYTSMARHIHDSFFRDRRADLLAEGQRDGLAAEMSIREEMEDIDRQLAALGVVAQTEADMRDFVLPAIGAGEAVRMLAAGPPEGVRNKT